MILIMIIINHVMITEINMIMDIIIIIIIIIQKKVAMMMMNMIMDTIMQMIFIIMVQQIGAVMNINEWVLKLTGINLILIKIGKMLMMLKVKEYILMLMKQLTMNGSKIYIIKVINISEKVFNKKMMMYMHILKLHIQEMVIKLMMILVLMIQMVTFKKNQNKKSFQLFKFHNLKKIYLRNLISNLKRTNN